MSRTALRLFSAPLRYSARASLSTAARSSRPSFNQRMMSYESHASHSSAPSDKPWIIGSALVFGPLFLYLVSPSARKGSHGSTDHGHENHHDKHEDKHVQHTESRREENATPVISDDEGTRVSAQEVKESMEKAFEVDSPKDAKEHEEAPAAVTAVVEESITDTEVQAEPSTDATVAAESVAQVETTSHVTSDEQDTTSEGKASKPAAE